MDVGALQDLDDDFWSPEWRGRNGRRQLTVAHASGGREESGRLRRRAAREGSPRRRAVSRPSEGIFSFDSEDCEGPAEGWATAQEEFAGVDDVTGESIPQSYSAR